MFIRQYSRKVNGKRQAYWALVESYRTERGPRQRVVAWLGKMDEAGRLGMQQAAESATHKDTPPQDGATQRALFGEETVPPTPRWVNINVHGVRVENCRQFGGPWLAMELIRHLQLDEFLQRELPEGREHVPWSLSALILIIARLLEPASELYTAEQWYPKTALSDLLGVQVDSVDDNRLYRRIFPWRNEDILVISEATASKSASAWWYRGAECRWGTRSFQATPPTSPLFRRLLV